MRMTRLDLAGRGSWPSISVEGLARQINLFYAPPHGGKSTLADFIGQLLYGKALRKRRHGAASTPRMRAAGTLQVTSVHGDFLLELRHDDTSHDRLIVSAASGGAVDRQTMESLLAGVPPQLLSTLYAVDFAESPSVEELLSGAVARHFASSLGSVNRQPSVQLDDINTDASRRRLAQLFERRDAATRELEERLAVTRRDSTVAHHETTELERLLVERRRRIEEIQLRLQGHELELAEIDSQLRYFSLEATSYRAPCINSEQLQTELASLDAAINRCRTMLSDLQSREAAVRRELAEVHPDGTADHAGSLADQRATLRVLEHLLNDLDAEVAQLARGAASVERIGLETHARFTPVAEMLRHQLYALCGQVSEQQRALRRTQLAAESRQLARSQTDLSEQLEHLLDRRQVLLHSDRVARRTTISLPTAPAASLCQCDGHDEFVVHSAANERLEATPRSREEVNRQRRLEVLSEVETLRRNLAEAKRALAHDQARWESLQRDRRGAIDSHAVERLRSELQALEAEIDDALRHGRERGAPSRDLHIWKASDVLAQLTDGQLVQIRLSDEGRVPTLVDARGRALGVESLNPQQYDQLYLALTLALVSSHTARGIEMPLLLDEPFLRQDRAAAATMAGVLEAFARQGRQVVVLTENVDAKTRFQSLGAAVWDLDLMRRQRPHPHNGATVPPSAALEKESAPLVTPPTEIATVRVVRESVDGGSPQLRVTGAWVAGDDDADFFYLEQHAPLSAFPVLGPNTQALLDACDVHTVDQLLAADAQRVAAELRRSDVSPQTVELWQIHMSLMCFIPGVSLDDAQVLAACGINAPSALSDADLGSLAGRVGEWLATPSGERFRHRRARFSIPQLEAWRRSAGAHRARWREARGRYGWVGRPRRTTQPISQTGREVLRVGEDERLGRGDRGAGRQEGGAGRRSNDLGPRRRSQRPERADNQTETRERQVGADPDLQRTKRRRLRFLLQRQSPVVDAPAIGEKTAERLAHVGIRTVADLLNADPESTAAELGIRNVTAELFADWQRQARLVCCIPELHGYGAQILVGCGMTEPQQIARADVSDLYRKVQAYCRTKPGQRILRNGKTPPESKVAEWVAFAAHMRPLEAA